MANKRGRPRKTVRGEITKRQVARSLSAVDPEEAREIAADLAEQKEQEIEDISGERVPGKVIGKFKTAFTLQDLEHIHGIVTFTPEETIGFTIQGVKRQFLSGVECTVPGCFKVAYELRKKGLLKPTSLPDMGYININQPGAGTLD